MVSDKQKSYWSTMQRLSRLEEKVDWLYRLLTLQGGMPWDCRLQTAKNPFLTAQERRDLTPVEESAPVSEVGSGCPKNAETADV